MARYDWPAPPGKRDDPVGRAGHLSRFRPRVDLTAFTQPLPAVVEEIGAGAPVFDLPAGDANLWFPIGPSVMVNGQATGTPNVAGRIRDLQVEPTAGQRVYAASASGGVWYSADRGATWRPLDDWQESPDRSAIGVVANALACGAVHVIWGAGADGSQDDVWVGTGEMGGAGPLPGGHVAGVGFLHATGPATGGAWQVVKGDPVTVADSLRGRIVYRIVGDPGEPQQLVAATSNGLFVLPSGGSWTQAAHWPAGTDPIDVSLTRTAGKVRIWVAARSALWVAETVSPIDPATVTFTQVTLPNVVNNPHAVWPDPTDTRLAVAATADGTKLFVLGRRTAVHADNRRLPPAALWVVDATAAVAGLAATALPGVPLDLFGTDNDQSDYDMCVVTHPTVAGRVYVGGSTIRTSGGYNAAIYRCETTASAATPTSIGDGVHPDVHQLRFGPAPPSDGSKRTLWVCCDGGVFRSDADGDPSSFVARNDGLAVLEPGYVASHPTNAGIVAAGFQDNGTAIRVGDSVWRQAFRGDGGGVVFDPGAPNRYFRQYIRAEWESSDGGAVAPVKRRDARSTGGNLKTSEQIEDNSSRFYTGADAVVLGGDTHLAFGSDRVWYSRDWGRSWVTLPTATDPRAGDNPDLKQDVLDPIAIPKGDPHAYGDKVGSTDCCSSTYIGSVAIGSGIMAVKFAVPADSGGNHVLRVLALYAGGLVWLTGTRPATGSGAFTWAAPTPAAPLKVQRFRFPLTPAETNHYNSGDPLSFLPAPWRASDVAVHDPDRGPLGSCYVTTVGDQAFGAGTPGERRDTLWFFDGDSTWVPCGLRTNNPRGTWTGTRVTAPALGVVVDPDDHTVVYVGTSVGVVKGVLTIGGTASAPTYAWAWEQFSNGLPEAAVQDLSIHHFSGVKLLRVALQARGIWEVDLAGSTSTALSYLRLYPSDTRRRLPTPLAGPTTAGEPGPHWDDSPDIVIDTTGATAADPPPTEAQLMALHPLPAGSAGRVLLGARHPVVHVLVHQRWREAVDPTNLRVALVRHDLPASGVVQLGGLWAALVAAAGSGVPPASLPDGWTQAAGVLWQHPGRQLDTRVPAAASFDLDLSGDDAGTAFVLLAVVMSATDQISPADLALSSTTNATTADQLVVASPHVAAKSVELTTSD